MQKRLEQLSKKSKHIQDSKQKRNNLNKCTLYKRCKHKCEFGKNERCKKVNKNSVKFKPSKTTMNNMQQQGKQVYKQL